MEATSHICGLCQQTFATEAEYIAHVCAKTNLTPADADHFGPEFKEVQRYALERGAARIDAKADPESAAAQEEAIAEVVAEEKADAVEVASTEEADTFA